MSKTLVGIVFSARGRDGRAAPVSAPFRRGLNGLDIRELVPPLNAAGTAQRAVPTTQKTYYESKVDQMLRDAVE